MIILSKVVVVIVGVMVRFMLYGKNKYQHPIPTHTGIGTANAVKEPGICALFLCREVRFELIQQLCCGYLRWFNSSQAFERYKNAKSQHAR